MNKNKLVLDDFVRYCDDHPEQRFWQALRNWSGFHFILKFNNYEKFLEGIDTFYFEGKDK